MPDDTTKLEGEGDDIRYKAMLESLDAMIVRVDLENRFTYVNPRYCETFGKGKSELIGKSFFPLVHEDDQASTTEAMKELYKPPYRCQLVQRAKTVQGWRWLHWDDHAILDDDGNILEIQGVGRDVTEEKLRERELLYQQQRLSLAQQFARIGLWEYSIQSDSLHWSNECKAIFGVADDEFNGRFDGFLMRVHPDDRPYALKVCQPIVEDKVGIPLEYEHRIVRGDGSIGWVREIAGFFEDPNEGGRLIGFVMDITAQKAQEAELERADKVLQIMENVEGVFLLFSADRQKILYVSERYSVVTGNSVEELYENPYSIFEHVIPADRENVFAAHRDFLNSGIFDLDFRIGNSDGEIRSIYLKVFPVYDDAGSIIRHAGLAYDISKQKQQEEALLKTTEKAEESSRLKSAFLASINHELRTPLSHILNYSELIRAVADNEEISAFADGIHNSASQLLAMFEDIMTLSSVERGALVLRTENFRLESLMREAEQILQQVSAELGKKGELELIVETDSSLAAIELQADRRKILQILSNLIRNAVKFTESGFVRLTARESVRHGIDIKIEDSGIGIPASELNNIFGFFRQVDESRNRKFEGLGIGLALSKKVADFVDACIHVQSEEGRGSAFTLELPPSCLTSVKELY